MESLKKIDFKKISVPKAIGLGILAVILLFVVISLIGSAFRIAFNNSSYDHSYGSAPSYYGEADYAMEEMAFDDGVGKLSIRNAIAPVPGMPQSTGNTAEDFEITEFRATIETGNLDKTCTTVEDLKAADYIIFENANRYDSGCNYTFKVENDRVEEVLAVVKSLKPESFNENTRTIKSIVDDYTSEVEILEKKLASIEETLTDAQRAYDEVEVLATRTQDVESLAKIIDSKIGLIERLTNERIEIKQHIDILNRAKAAQLDRLAYTFFYVNAYESHIVDFERLKDSWTYEVKRLVTDLNKVVQNLTVNLIGFAGKAIVVAVYILLAILVLKYGWRGVRKLWKM